MYQQLTQSRSKLRRHGLARFPNEVANYKPHHAVFFPEIVRDDMDIQTIYSRLRAAACIAAVPVTVFGSVLLIASGSSLLVKLSI